MSNIMTDFKKYLQFLSPEEQICEINGMINEIYNLDQTYENIKRKFSIINDLKILKNK